jgi:hypothetical protein
MRAAVFAANAVAQSAPGFAELDGISSAGIQRDDRCAHG